MRLGFKILFFIFMICPLFLMTMGCTYSLPKHAFIVKDSVLKRRVLQTQHFQNVKKKQLISAILGVMQDLNFKFDEGDNDLGILVGSKKRSFIMYVEQTKQQTQKQMRMISFTPAPPPPPPAHILHPPAPLYFPPIPVTFIEETRISIIIYPSSQRKNRVQRDFSVRANLQKITWMKSTGQITKAKAFESPAFYKDFFSKLSKSIFLEKNL